MSPVIVSLFFTYPLQFISKLRDSKCILSLTSSTPILPLCSKTSSFSYPLPCSISLLIQQLAQVRSYALRLLKASEQLPVAVSVRGKTVCYRPGLDPGSPLLSSLLVLLHPHDSISSLLNSPSMDLLQYLCALYWAPLSEMLLA